MRAWAGRHESPADQGSQCPLVENRDEWGSLCADASAGPRIRIQLFSILRFAFHDFLVRNGHQIVHKIRELLVFLGMFHL
jgi:hypothetical protein